MQPVDKASPVYMAEKREQLQTQHVYQANCLWHIELVYIFNGYDKEDKIIEKRFIPQP